jgi:chorismate mutase/prephenate dehydrogenase
MPALDDLRARLDVLDRNLLELVAERQVISSQIAEVKRATGQSTRDFARERDVLLKARRDATELGVAPALAESILRALIRGSLTTQERVRVVAQGQGTGRTALVIGGRGKMGRWMADFVASQGFHVTIADPCRRGRGSPMGRGLDADPGRPRSGRRGHADADGERRAQTAGRAQATRVSSSTSAR